ncbi:hypothetical protein [Halorubrum gandharaense]
MGLVGGAEKRCTATSLVAHAGDDLADGGLLGGEGVPVELVEQFAIRSSVRFSWRTVDSAGRCFERAGVPVSGIVVRWSRPGTPPALPRGVVAVRQLLAAVR